MFGNFADAYDASAVAAPTGRTLPVMSFDGLSRLLRRHCTCRGAHGVNFLIPMHLGAISSTEMATTDTTVLRGCHASEELQSP
jgi:hypothetical protein